MDIMSTGLGVEAALHIHILWYDSGCLGNVPPFTRECGDHVGADKIPGRFLFIGARSHSSAWRDAMAGLDLLQYYQIRLYLLGV